jgi:bifunctional enzyme CysN/CysC
MTVETLPTTLDETVEFLNRCAAKELLRFVTCGSVDDGKSTLIGRLLLETGAVLDDQIAALRHDSVKHGTTGEEFDPALLVDGLEDERQQGITIDVAYRYFQTSKRKFIIADSPGHEQYTRNMATAASTAQAAIILMDARKGMLAQTRRHSYIASLLGVRTLILAVNKMDLVDFSEAVFADWRREFLAFAKQMDVRDVYCVPLSALRGDNLVRRSERMHWYSGPPLLELLETLPIRRDREFDAFRFSVQRVERPDADFRGYSGTVLSGSVQVGDRIMVLPSRQESQVRSIVTFDGSLPSATASQAVTLTMDTEIDVARGDVIAHPDRLPTVAKQFDAMLVCMSAQPLTPGKSYWLKHGSRHTSAEVEVVHYGIDVNTLGRVESRRLQLNEIGFCRIASHASLAFDPYRRNRRTGSFILVDRITHETVAAGMIVGRAETKPDAASQGTATPTSERPVRGVSAAARQAKFGHPACTVLLTGLNSPTNDHLPYALEERLFACGIAAKTVEFDSMELGSESDSPAGRTATFLLGLEVCRQLNNAGLVCVASVPSANPLASAKAKEAIGADRLLHLDCQGFQNGSAAGLKETPATVRVEPLVQQILQRLGFNSL